MLSVTRHYTSQTTREKKPITCSVSLVVDSIWRTQTQSVCPKGMGYFHRMRGIKVKRKFNKQLKHPPCKNYIHLWKTQQALSFLSVPVLWRLWWRKLTGKYFLTLNNDRRLTINGRSRPVFLSKGILTVLNVISFSFTAKSLLTMEEEFVYENKRRDLTISRTAENKRQVFFFFELRGCNGLARPHGSKLQPRVTNTYCHLVIGAYHITGISSANWS